VARTPRLCPEPRPRKREFASLNEAISYLEKTYGRYLPNPNPFEGYVVLTFDKKSPRSTMYYCLYTFMLEKRDNKWVITDARVKPVPPA